MPRPPHFFLSDCPGDEEEIYQVFHELTGVARDRIYYMDDSEWDGQLPPILFVDLSLTKSKELPYGYAIDSDGSIKFLDWDSFLALTARELSYRWQIKTYVELGEAQDYLALGFNNGTAFRCERGHFERTGTVKPLEHFDFKNLKK